MADNKSTMNGGTGDKSAESRQIDIDHGLYAVEVSQAGYGFEVGEYVQVDPTATPLAGDPVLIWWKSGNTPGIAILAFAMPPKEMIEAKQSEVRPMLTIEDPRDADHMRVIGFDQIAHVHKIIGTQPSKSPEVSS